MSADSVNRLQAIYDASITAFQELGERGLLVGSDDVSEFWRELLDDPARRSYPPFNEMLAVRRGATWPMAERSAEELHAGVEEAHARTAYTIASRSVPAGFLARVEESPVGAPLVFPFPEGSFSANALTNAITAWRLVDWCERLGLDRPLRILEVGAGFGQMAHQLHGLLEIESYTICDLPENLFLSSWYLQAAHPELEARLVTRSDAAPAALNFLTPPLLELAGGPYDLVVNAYSFQEMNRATVERYFAHARATLADDGVLYSLNSHGKSGIETPGQYPLGGFRLLGIGAPRAFPFQLNATEPYELALARGDGAPVDAVDSLGRAYQLGFHEELEPIAAGLAAGSADGAPWLDALRRLLGPGTTETKEEALADLRSSDAAPAATALLAAWFDVARDRPEEADAGIAAALELLPPTTARVHAHVARAALAHRRNDQRVRDLHSAAAHELAPHLAGDADRLIPKYHGVVGQAAAFLGLPQSTRAVGARALRRLRAPGARSGRHPGLG